MVVSSPTRNSREFSFTFKTGKPSLRHVLRVPVPLPSSIIYTNEFAERLIATHNLPCFVEDDLKQRLKDFIVHESNKIKDENAKSALSSMKDGRAPKGVMELADMWTKAYTREWKQFAKPEEPTDGLLFSEVYHSLIHSAAMETLLHIEHRYALVMEDLVRQRDEDLEIMEAKQEEEMVLAVRGLGVSHTDKEINDLAAQHFEAVQMAESRWASEISSFRDTQRREYRSWVIQVHEELQSQDDLPSYLNKIKTLFDSKVISPAASSPPVVSSSPSTPILASLRRFKQKEASDLEAEFFKEVSSTQPKMEESFTIHLGTQMKTSYNLRLLCCDVIDHLCLHRPMKVDGQLLPSPQRLQTAMGLYSNNLTGMILLVDCRLNSYSGIKRRFSRVSESSTDFHFDDLEKQFARIRLDLDAVNRSRCDPLPEGHDVAESSSDTLEFLNVAEVVEKETTHLRPGDFYVTRHSNLAQVHTVFHLAMDDTARDGNMTSRHYSILSIRNILKLCSQCDLTTIGIPLLLTHEMGEEMTIPWCIKRAELIFKCVKGFMMEMAAWNGTGNSNPNTLGASDMGQRNRTIQFLVPPGIDDSLFQTFCNMLPGIFRLSNPLIVKSAQGQTTASTS